MSRRDLQRLEDIDAAVSAIEDYLERGELSDPLVFDAVRMRLIEIGEAAKALSQELTTTEGDVPWSPIAKMRDQLTHRYFGTEIEIIRATVDNDLRPLRSAIKRLKSRL